MSFLDEARQDWSKPELPALRDLFILAYRRLSVVEQLADEAGIVPGTFPITDDLRSTWTQLSKVTGNQGRLRALVEKAAWDTTVSAYGQRFGEMLEEHPPVVMPTTGMEDPALASFLILARAAAAIPQRQRATLPRPLFQVGRSDMNGTSILDSAPLRWGNQRIRDLRDALAAACDRPDHIRDLVQSVPGFPANDVNLYQNPQGANAIWKDVMFAAANAGVLRVLLEVVLADRRISAHHGGIRKIIDELDGSTGSVPDNGTLPPIESISITSLGTILATELAQLSDQLIEQVQRLAACGDRLEIALAAEAATNVTERIAETLKSIDKIGLGKAAETPEDDRDNAYRREIRRELENFSSFLSGTVASRGNTVSVTGLAATADRIRLSATGLADLRARRPHPE